LRKAGLGNEIVAGNNGTLMFVPVSAHCRLNSYLLPTERDISLCFLVAAMSAVVDAEKLICEVEKMPLLYNKTMGEYSDRNLKQKLWREKCE
jgi:hypothetical protein